MQKVVNLTELSKEAEDFAKKLKPQKKQATVIGLYGDLGSGKTTFTQAVAKKLKIDNYLTSPTFVIQKKYKIKSKNPFKYLYHLDAYRLENAHSLKVLNFENVLEDPKNLIFIEWPENVSDILPKNMIKIYFKFIDDKTREIKFKK